MKCSKGLDMMLLKSVFLLFALFFLNGCGEKESLKVGFIGGTSGRVADLGISGRNGVILAIEQRNSVGGIHGQSIEILLKDDKQEKGLAAKAAEELIAANVQAIIGPMTSSMSVEVVPVSERFEMLTMGTTATSNELSGKDDYFFRTLSSTVDHASEVANYLRKNKQSTRISAIYDLKNRAYTESWLNDFSRAFEKQGGEMVNEISFSSGNKVKFDDIARAAIAGNSEAETPDTIVLVVNSVDAALLAKQIRTMSPDIQLATSEWAGTERLIELGGVYVENTVVPQYFDRDSKNPKYRRFYDAYFQRFGQPPGFPGLVGFNATNVVLDALAAKLEGENLKQTILRLREFPAIQENIVFDSFGDTKSKTYLTEVINGQFRLGQIRLGK